MRLPFRLSLRHDKPAAQRSWLEALLEDLWPGITARQSREQTEAQCRRLEQTLRSIRNPSSLDMLVREYAGTLKPVQAEYLNGLIVDDTALPYRTAVTSAMDFLKSTSRARYVKTGKTDLDPALDGVASLLKTIGICVADDLRSIDMDWFANPANDAVNPTLRTSLAQWRDTRPKDEIQAEIARLAHEILDKFGPQHQATILIEEMAELTQVLCKIQRGKFDKDKLSEEFTHVQVSSEVIRQLMRIPDTDIRRNVLEKLRSYAENGDAGGKGPKP